MAKKSMKPGDMFNKVSRMATKKVVSKGKKIAIAKGKKKAKKA